MSDDRREQAPAAWHKLLDEPEIRMDVEEQYDELLKMADDFKLQGIIDRDDWRDWSSRRALSMRMPLRA